MPISKRDLLRAMSGVAALASLGAGTPAFSETTPSQGVPHDMSGFPPNWYGSEKIVFLAYPQFTALDLVGPHYMLGNLMGATMIVAAKTRAPVESDMKLAIQPSATFDECPKDIDIIVVPGGSQGTLAAIQDEETMAFVKDRGSRAKFVTSVCTGSLVLGAAGLLKGYKATSHWAARDLLSIFGAEPVNQRVVIDRNRITGGGVTAGLDFGLTLVARLRDDNYAKAVQLLAEYEPDPPLDAGTPETAGPETTQMISGMFTQFLEEAKRVANTAASRL